MALVNREHTVREGEVIRTEVGGEYLIHKGRGGGLEVTAGVPLTTDESGSRL